MICVYPSDCNDFSSNGLGAVTPMSCTVTETLNGEWELTLVHDIDERGKWTRLSEGCILRAPVPAAMTPSVDLVTQQYQTSTYDVQIYKITTKSGPLHLRSGTGTNYKILGKYKKGREVIVLNKTTSSWHEVTAPDGKHGYMASQYLTFQRAETQTVQTNVGFRNQVIVILSLAVLWAWICSQQRPSLNCASSIRRLFWKWSAHSTIRPANGRRNTARGTTCFLNWPTSRQRPAMYIRKAPCSFGTVISSIMPTCCLPPMTASRAGQL